MRADASNDPNADTTTGTTPPSEGYAIAWRALPWRPFRFDGRLGRGEFLWALVLWHVASSIGATLLLMVVLFPLGLVADASAMNVGGLVTIGLAVAAYLAGVASYAVRRLHDLGRSGAWVAVGFVPLLNIPFAFSLLAAPGAPGENAYGRRTFASKMRAAIAASEAAHEDVLDEAFEAGRRFAEGRRDPASIGTGTGGARS